MDELTPEENQRCVKSLLRIVECPVCHDQMHANEVIQCSIGHVFCTPCRQQVARCPLCQGSFISAKPLAFCQILEALPQTCRNRGCSRLVREGDNHEVWCGYRETTCLYCSNKFFGQDIPNHLKTVHQMTVRNQDFKFEKTLSNFTSNSKMNVAYIKLFSGLHFICWYYSEVALKTLKVRIIFVPSGVKSENDCLEGCLKIFSDTGVRFSVSKKLNMSFQATNTLFSVHESSLKEFWGCKNVSFQTIIRKPKAEKHILSSPEESLDGPSIKKVK